VKLLAFTVNIRNIIMTSVDCYLLCPMLCPCSIAGTLSGLRMELKDAMEKLTGSDHGGQITAVKSGYELFLRFITLCKLEDRVSLSPT